MFKNPQHEKNVAFAVSIGNLSKPPAAPAPEPSRPPCTFKDTDGKLYGPPNTKK